MLRQMRADKAVVIFKPVFPQQILLPALRQNGQSGGQIDRIDIRKTVSLVVPEPVDAEETAQDSEK